MSGKIRMGMIGGGTGAFIGAIHRFAALGDGLIELVAGAFSSDPAVSAESGKNLFMDPARVYSSYREMIEKEATLPAELRMHFVAIVTPNFAHFDPAMLALDHGFHVLLEKPMTLNTTEARELEQKVNSSGLILGLTHTYTGYPMVKQARQMVKEGKLGKLRKIYVHYHQGWLSRLSESEGNKQASWRTDPSKSGKCGAMGDIGTHAFNLAEYISGLEVKAINAMLNTMVEGRKLDDDGMVMLQFSEGVSGILTATQVAAGEENDLRIHIYGEDGGLEWHQMEPNTLIYKPLEGPAQIFRAGNGYLGAAAAQNARTPGGHPEGYLEAFANIYRNFAKAVSARLNNEEHDDSVFDFPGVKDGVRGMAFIDHVVKSSDSNEKWIPFRVES